MWYSSTKISTLLEVMENTHPHSEFWLAAQRQASSQVSFLPVDPLTAFEFPHIGWTFVLLWPLHYQFISSRVLGES